MCSFVAKNFYTPKNNTCILFYVDAQNKKERILPQDTEKIKIVRIKSNPQHSSCYFKFNDQNLLDDIRCKYFKKDNEFNIELPNCTEQSLSIICDRTKLEDSTSKLNDDSNDFYLTSIIITDDDVKKYKSRLKSCGLERTKKLKNNIFVDFKIH